METRRPCSCALLGAKVPRRRWASRADWAALLEQARALLEAGHADVGGLAASLGMSEFHFRRGFRDAYGCSPGEYAQSCRLARAAQLLLRTDSSVQEIGLDAGFCSPSSFVRAFRRRFGVTPGAYRRGRAPGANAQTRHIVGGSP